MDIVTLNGDGRTDRASLQGVVSARPDRSRLRASLQRVTRLSGLHVTIASTATLSYEGLNVPLIGTIHIKEG